MWKRTSRIINILTGGADECFCSRVYRNYLFKGVMWTWAKKVLDRAFLFWEEQHCFYMYVQELKRNPKEKTMGMKTKIAIIAIFVAGLVMVAQLSFALNFVQAAESMKPQLMRSGAICDTIEGVEERLIGIREFQKNGTPRPEVKGCGYIARPVLVTITPVKVFEVEKGVKIYIGKYLMGREQIVQYGWYKVVSDKAQHKPQAEKVRTFDV